MTAVEWLVQEINKINASTEAKRFINKLEKQAKEMEKKQIIDACNQTEFEDIDGMGIHETITKGEEYYNVKFK